MLRPMRSWSWAVPLALFLGACQTRPPANWAQGGSPLDIPRARWTRGSRIIDIMPDGKVLADGEHMFTVDRAGRIYETDNDPIAVLQADGQLVGTGDTSMGKIGLRNASLPGKQIAWLSLGEQGEVQRFDPDGEPHPDGTWAGCGPAIRACTLTTHIIALVESRRRGSGYGTYGPSVGIGFGFGMVVAP
jgi:hypothetical protein